MTAASYGEVDHDRIAYLVALAVLPTLGRARFSGLDWPTGARLARALVRRGTDLSEWTLAVPYLPATVQWVMPILESPPRSCCRCAATGRGQSWPSSSSAAR